MAIRDCSYALLSYCQITLHTKDKESARKKRIPNIFKKKVRGKEKLHWCPLMHNALPFKVVSCLLCLFFQNKVIFGLSLAIMV